MEGAEPFLLMGIHGPCLTAIEWVLGMQALYAAIFIFMVNLRVVHTLDVRQASVVAAFLILLSISGSRERLLVMVDPRYMNW